MRDLNAYLNKSRWPLFDHWCLLDCDLPPDDYLLPARGVYVISLTEIEIPYPEFPSSIVYIGEAHGSGGLRSRLSQHHQALAARREGKPLHGEFTHSRYGWMAAYGARCVWAEAPIGMPTQPMEAALIEVFEREHGGVVPVGNKHRGAADDDVYGGVAGRPRARKRLAPQSPDGNMYRA